MLIFSSDNSQVVAIETPNGRKKPWANPACHPPSTDYALVGPTLYQAYQRGDVTSYEWSRGWALPFKFSPLPATKREAGSVSTVLGTPSTIPGPFSTVPGAIPDDLWVPRKLSAKKHPVATVARRLTTTFEEEANDFGGFELPPGYLTPPRVSPEEVKPKKELSADRKAAMVSVVQIQSFPSFVIAF